MVGYILEEFNYTCTFLNSIVSPSVCLESTW